MKYKTSLKIFFGFGTARDINDEVADSKTAYVLVAGINDV